MYVNNYMEFDCLRKASPFCTNAQHISSLGVNAVTTVRVVANFYIDAEENSTTSSGRRSTSQKICLPALVIQTKHLNLPQT